VLHWERVCYDVKTKDGGTRRILDNIDGFVRPGTLTVLMVSSSSASLPFNIRLHDLTCSVVPCQACLTNTGCVHVCRA
jgi:hypothetical protein